MNKKAILIIDMLNDFVNPENEKKEMKLLIFNINKLLEQAREKKDMIIYINDAHIIGDKELLEWGNHAIKGTEGAKVVNDLSPNKEDLIIEKRTFDGFYNTSLNSVLKANNIKNLVLCGLYGDICVMHTATTALNKKYNVTILNDCTLNYYDKEITNIINELKLHGNIVSLSLNEYINGSK